MTDYRGRSGPPAGILPAEGPRKRPPAWPLPDPAPEELALWRSLWRRPVAHLWTAQRQEPAVVARYVRLLVEQPGHSSLAVQESALGLTPASLARMGLRVEDWAPAAVDDDGLTPEQRTALARVRDRHEDAGR